jgi:hypothetical protein
MNAKGHETQYKYVISSVAVLGILVLALLTGCKSKDQQALDQAKSQAVTTNTPQQVQYIDGKGNLITQTVQPPATQGAQPLVTSTTQPPPAGPVPAETNPVITPLGSNAGGYSSTSPNGTSGAPVAPPPAPGPFSLTVPAGTSASKIAVLVITSAAKS